MNERSKLGGTICSSTTNNKVNLESNIFANLIASSSAISEISVPSCGTKR
jgi:hypothetical protein